MNILSFFEHHGIHRNPFAEEDAQTDPVFKDHCISNAYHPVWDKVYGDPRQPSTAVVFGSKGSGKTAIGLQIQDHLSRYNQQNPDRRVFVIRYDDFNPFLDHFQQRFSRRSQKKPEKLLDAWRLWDHVDALLCIAVTAMVESILEPENKDSTKGVEIDRGLLKSLSRHQGRDLLLLDLLYDQSTGQGFAERWNDLRKQLGYRNWGAGWDFWLGIASVFVGLGVCGSLFFSSHITFMVAAWLLVIIVLAGWGHYLVRWARCWWYARGITRKMRVGKRDRGSLVKALMGIPFPELASQPMPRYERTDDRYELLGKFQALIKKLNYEGIIVLIDRVDEPHLLGGKTDLMRRFVWPLLDNKLLKHVGLGIKMLLPSELYRETERENREFHERARLDKQNLIPSFHWSGESLYDLTRMRIQACKGDGHSPEVQDLFEQSIDRERLLRVMESLRTPRHLFRFLYMLIVEHCNKHTDDQPSYQIDSTTFETSLAVYSREMEKIVG